MTRTRFSLLAAGLLLCGPLSGQETDFDLAAQRSESQDVRPVPGHAVDHGGLPLNPVPHSLVRGEGRLDVSGGVRLRGEGTRFAADLGFLPLARKGTALSVEFGAKAAARRGVKPLSGAYALRIDGSGIALTGYDERGAFYAVQTLRQIAESPAAAGGLPFVEIADYPDLPTRGVVEGFYGTPWPHAVRLSLIDFYGRFKMNSYLYGPKDDPYHSCPDWRLPYPEPEARQIRELVEACRRNYVDFVWAIHPGQDIRWNEEDYRNLVQKFEWMYDLGVRAFAIFFDDISGDGTDPGRQTELLNRLDADFVRTKGDVAPLVVCPTDYSRLWANPTPQGSLAIYGRTLDPSVRVFWTGDVVCSDLTPETLAWVDSRIGRPGVLLVELSGDGLCAPYPDAGSGLWVGHDALRPTTCAASSATRWNTARRRSWRFTAWPTTRGTRRPTIRSTTGSGGSRNWFPRRARRTAPSPSIRATRRRLPPRRVVGDRDVPHRRLHSRGRAAALRRSSAGGCGARRAGGALRQPGAAGRAAAVARGVPQAGRTGAPDARSHRMLRDGRRRGVLERLRPQPDERRRPQCLRGPQVRHDEAPALLRAGDGRHGRGFFTRLTGDRPASARGIGSFPTPRHDAEPPDGSTTTPGLSTLRAVRSRPATGSASIWEPCARFPR